MGISCNSICHRYKATKPGNMGRYAIGQKRCNVCEIFLNWDGISCPCCGMMLRTRLRSIKVKTGTKKMLRNKL